MPFDNMLLSIFAIIFLIATCIIQIQFTIQRRLNKVYFVYIKLLYNIIEDIENAMCVTNRTSNTAHNEGNNPSNIEKGQEDERRDD